MSNPKFKRWIGLTLAEYGQESDWRNPAYEQELTRVIREQKIMVSGAQHQQSFIPEFEDGTHLLYSWRAWGGLMADIWSAPGEVYDYMDFYMGTPENPMGDK